MGIVIRYVNSQVADDLCRVADGGGVGGQVLCHHGTGPYNGVLADGDSGQDQVRAPTRIW